MSKPTISSLYVYDSLSFPALSYRQQPKGTRYTYTTKSGILNSKDSGYIHRYARTVDIKGIRKTLLFISLNEIEDVEDKLESAKEKIENDEVLIRKFNQSTRKPTELDIDMV